MVPIRKEIQRKKIDPINVANPVLIKSLSSSDLQPKIGSLKSAPAAGSTQRTRVDKKYNRKTDKTNRIIPPLSQ